MGSVKSLPSEEFTAPAYQLDAFNCPHCGSYNEQTWFLSATVFRTASRQGVQEAMHEFAFALCRRCGHNSVWVQSTEPAMVYPGISAAPRAHPDMPAEVAADFDEARGIVGQSPRGAAALLRLATEKLVGLLIEDKDQKKASSDLNEDIAMLVRHGLPVKIQQALDSLRVIGNEAVHPGTLDLKDDGETALKLFRLVNIIVENQISEPKAIEAIYSEKLPASKKAQIDRRDE